MMLFILTGSATAEMRTWTSKNGDTVVGEYVTLAFEKVSIKREDGNLIQVPLEQLSDEDQKYVDYKNPPELSIDYRESLKANKFIADAWHPNAGGTVQNHEITYTDAQFGALIKQKSRNIFDHNLTIEMYIFTEQYLDPDRYHLISRIKSKPFKLTKENDLRYTFDSPQKHTIIHYNLYSKYPRGEKASKYLILVRDDRGEIIAHKARSEWIYKNLDKLEKLPVGAWINDKCERIHPESPPRTRRDEQR